MIPDGYHTITPYLTVDDAGKLIEFVKAAFDANVLHAMTNDEGNIRHAEAQIGDSKVMIAQAFGEWTPRPSTLYLYVDDTDETYRRALAAGAKSLMEPADQFYGDRNGGVEDAFGNWWWIATRIEDVSEEELQRRAAALGR
ncbi:MAG TPA: VOC family protein [Thermoanaerobaculia bacterium]|nr:VOC family protein [Thermoanaerobaculia bacterium]